MVVCSIPMTLSSEHKDQLTNQIHHNTSVEPYKLCVSLVTEIILHNTAINTTALHLEQWILITHVARLSHGYKRDINMILSHIN